jgi:DnaJ-class molecular chaperone
MKGRSSATFFSDPVLLARQRCEHCHGEGKVPTPEFAGWKATVEQARRYLCASGEVGFAGDEARRQAGPCPEPTHAPCKGCKGRGYNRVEVPLERLADLLNGDKAA